MATYTTDKIEFGGNVYKLQDSDALPLAGGNVTGPVSFGDSVTMEEASVGDIVITGNASATNNLQANTINGVEVGTTPKFTDTVTTVSTTGSGNAVTAISASNGAITATKGTTFLTSHQDISGKADKSATVSTVAWDSTNKKLTKTINGTTSDVVTAATLRTGLNVADGAEVNQNAFSSIMGFTGSTPFVPDSENASISAQTKTSTAYIHAGNNINITDYIGFTTNPSTEVSGIQISATDTTYESKTAASGGTDVSLVTTGEKYTWNNKLASHQTIKQDGITGAIINRYGVCNTAAATAAKTVNITTGTFTLETGTKVTVNFTNKNTADNPTLNVNSTGAKNIFHNGAQITTDTNKEMLYGTIDFIYDGTQWQLIGNYVDTDTNTIGYKVGTTYFTLPVSAKTYRYRLLFMSPDGTKFVPANASTSTNATDIKTVNQEKIDPFGGIRYYGTTSGLAENACPNKEYLWQQTNVSLGYSFNTTGTALTLTDKVPVYIKCTPQTDGSVIIDPTTPYTQALPSVQDGKVYIFLGIATSSTAVEMVLFHPIYEYKNGQIRQWTNAIVNVAGVNNYSQITSKSYTGESLYPITPSTSSSTLLLQAGQNIYLDPASNYLGIYGTLAGTCSTAAATADKAVDIDYDTFEGFFLAPYTLIVVKFTETNSAAVGSLTLNVNRTGAKPIKYRGGNLSSADILAANRIYQFVYDGTNWELVGDLNTNTDTVGFQIRTNSRTFPVSGQTGRYRLLFTSSDHTHFVPANTLTSTSASTTKTVNQAKIDPFGEIIYYGHTAIVAADNYPNKTVLWQQNSVPLGYSFNTTGAALTLTDNTPVYIKCTPQTDGSAIIDPTTPYVQTLPSVQDGKIYIFLGTATSSTAVEMVSSHPVYEYKNGQVRQWTNAMGALSEAITTTATEITANKPITFNFPNGYINWHISNYLTGSTDLNNITYPCTAWCDNVTNKPSDSGQWGTFFCIGQVGDTLNDVQQFYTDFVGSGDPIMYVRWHVNNQWYAWRRISTPAYEDHVFQGAIASGTIGTRGLQIGYSINYEPTNIQIIHIQSSDKYMPIPFYANGYVYMNWYRTQSAAVSEADSKVKVRIFK